MGKEGFVWGSRSGERWGQMQVQVRELPVEVLVLNWEQMEEGKDMGMSTEVVVAAVVPDFGVAAALEPEPGPELVLVVAAEPQSQTYTEDVATNMSPAIRT